MSSSGMSSGAGMVANAGSEALSLVPMLVELIVWGARNDPRTAVPRTFIEQFDEDREALIEGIKARFCREVSGRRRSCQPPDAS